MSTQTMIVQNPKNKKEEEGSVNAQRNCYKKEDCNEFCNKKRKIETTMEATRVFIWKRGSQDRELLMLRRKLFQILFDLPLINYKHQY